MATKKSDNKCKWYFAIGQDSSTTYHEWNYEFSDISAEDAVETLKDNCDIAEDTIRVLEIELPGPKKSEVKKKFVTPIIKFIYK